LSSWSLRSLLASPSAGCCVQPLLLIDEAFAGGALGSPIMVAISFSDSRGNREGKRADGVGDHTGAQDSARAVI